MNWTNINKNYIVGTYDCNTDDLTKKSKIASFDLDYTLIKPTGGKKFSSGDSDWDFYDKSVKEKVRKYVDDGYNLVIISNQNGIEKGKTKEDVWKKKIENIAEELNRPFIILASIKKNCYRKPGTRLWSKYIKCNKKKSFYCGDAGGRHKRKINGISIGKDFSDSDMKFALNLGVEFIHRDKFIWDWKPKKVEIINYPINFDEISTGKYEDFVGCNKDEKEMIVCVGYPGSGKSYYTKNYIEPESYVRINRDTLKTPAKCLKVCKKNLEEGKNVVIDNTNSKLASRKKYIDLGKKYGYKIRCLIFKTSRELSKHNNYYRNYVTKDKTKIVPDVVYNIFRKNYRETEPSKTEGFYEIEKVHFVLELDKKKMKKYCKYFY